MIQDKFGNNLAVYGLGITGKASIEFLANHGIKPMVIDDAPADTILPVLAELDGKYSDTYFADKNHDWASIFNKLDTIIISPGIRLDSEIEQLAVKKQVRIVSEIEFASQLCAGQIICVSGSNGKSTTVTMIHKMLETAGFQSHLVGNIGIPFISAIDQIKTGDFVALEVSSYQLERIENLKPFIALLTNITEDHLARHVDMDGYIKAKGRMFENQDFNDHAILNHFDMLTWKAFNGAIASINVFSLDDIEDFPERELINGREVQTRAAMNGRLLCIKTHDDVENIIDANDLRIPGKHNIENSLAASLASYLAGVPGKYIKDALLEFRGIEHRIEFLGEFFGVRFYNDSKATNVESTITALKTFPEGRLSLILGGSEKGSDFEPLWRFLRDRDDPFVLYLTGPSGNRMSENIQRGNWKFDHKIYDKFDHCAKAAISEAIEGQIVLLSPACASFDEFKSFEHRGSRFKSILTDCLEDKNYGAK